ncbi:MAG TPA: DUF559 domain-containing protein [Solirubrobacteraceae bacterium]
MGDKACQRCTISQPELERSIRGLAGRQDRLVTRAQLFDLGLGRGAIRSRLANGSFVAVLPGVYALAPPRADPRARAWAAVLACGPNAILSHASAASLWGLTRRWRDPLEVTLTQGDRRPRGIRTHRCRTLRRVDTRRHLGIHVTSPARTILDIAPDTPDRILTRIVNDARREGLLHAATLADLLDRNRHHPGATRLNAFAETPTGPTRSEFEDAFLAFTKAHDLPTPLVNTRVAGYEVDALFEAEKLIVELDGWEFHNDRTAFVDDRERDSEMLKRGYATMRVTWERLRDTAGGEAARLHEILSQRR